MTVAATNSFNPTVVQLVTEAFRDLDIISDDEPLTGAQFNAGLFRLNSLVKSLEAQQIHVWTEEEAIVFLQPLQPRYTLGAPGAASLSAHSAPADEWLQTKMNASVGVGATVLPLQTTVGINSGDVIGIVVADGTTFWTTVNGAPAGGSVTITDPLTQVASSGNIVLDTPAGVQISRPLLIPRARTLTLQSVQENPMTVLSRQQYMDLPNKLSPGVPTQFFYTPQRDTGYLYIWPVPSTSAWAIRFTWYRPLADLLTPANTMDFPQEWCTPLRWLLANEMKLGYSIPPARAQEIKEQAALWTDVISRWDKESEPVQFGMDYWQYS